MGKPNIKTTIGFTPAAGVAGYGARIVVDGKEQPSITAGPEIQTLTIEAPEGAKVGVLLSSRSVDGIYSPATPFEFTVGLGIPPARPTNLYVAATEVAASAPAVEVNMTDEAVVFNITVTGSKMVKDGAVGTVVGFDPHHKVVLAIFPAAALQSGVPVNGPGGNEYGFPVSGTDGESVTIIDSRDQSTLTVQQYADAQLAAAGA